jgi:hypothetical protein
MTLSGVALKLILKKAGGLRPEPQIKKPPASAM